MRGASTTLGLFLLLSTLSVNALNNLTLVQEPIAYFGQNSDRQISDHLPEGSLSGISSPSNVPYNPIGITYHGGQVMVTGISLYFVWYGTWPETTKDAIKAFIHAMNDDPYATGSVRGWWYVTSQYYNNVGAWVSPNIRIVKEIFDDAPSLGTSITLDQADDVIMQLVSSGQIIPLKDSAVVFLASKDVNVSFKPGHCSLLSPSIHSPLKRRLVNFAQVHVLPPAL